MARTYTFIAQVSRSLDNGEFVALRRLNLGDDRNAVLPRRRPHDAVIAAANKAAPLALVKREGAVSVTVTSRGIDRGFRTSVRDAYDQAVRA